MRVENSAGASPGEPLRGRILVVDDEPQIGGAIRRTLRREHEVVTLTSAREAYARLRDGERFDLVLSDVMMPEMSGVELHQELSRLSPDLAARMVFLTGGAFTPYARSFLSDVENPRLEKPFSSEALRDLVQTLIQKEGTAVDSPRPPVPLSPWRAPEPPRS
ncbi:response regulator [Melittangium boletus]|uniref:Hybrid sensor histidine kinase/response regulator n=1 Tax=Melittangium boletus DSM 14713 TaxID=1294270 RepID=A0A250I7X9_9BACT|nr:response regulator [Melittangium boletus]ATB27875.1 hybrid sensor histidine kinase/response regulator [Melittangium boletus DSM 14713]